eukprot:12410484-Karenia_brevis.AAC.1
MEILRLALRLTEKDKDSGLLIECAHGACREYAFIAHSSHIERGSFQAECIRMSCVEEASGHAAGKQKFRMLRHPEDTWLHIQTETAFVLELAERAAVQWDMYELDSLPDTDSLGTRVASGSRKILELQALQQLERDWLSSMAAMRLFKMATGSARAGGNRGRTARGRGRAGRGRARGRGRGRSGPLATSSAGSSIPGKKKTPAMEDSTTDEDDDEEQEESDQEEEAEDVDAAGHALHKMC